MSTLTPTTEPTTYEQRRAYDMGMELHAAGETRPANATTWLAYKERAPWLLQGWDAAAQAAVVARVMEQSQPAWDASLRISGTTGEHVDADGTRHVAERRLHVADAGRPAYWQAVCPCSFESRFHYGSPFPESASGAAREWAEHLPATEQTR